ncbi:uncharacterized protein [Dendrobates tinctorius]|uniref:uncharacterized protein n=1 Tax=Dendrobates tinctorius TaxID=92724 RepID=UPI003CC9DC89
MAVYHTSRWSPLQKPIWLIRFFRFGWWSSWTRRQRRTRWETAQVFFRPAQETPGTSKHSFRRGGRRKNRRGPPEGYTSQYSISGKNNLVFNISTYCLSPAEIRVLQRGLSFCPTPSFDPFLVHQELNRFYRSLRLKVHFDKDGGDINTNQVPFSSGTSTQETFILKDLRLKIPSTFQPPRLYHPVETYISLVNASVDKYIDEIKHGKYHLKHNLNREESLALKSLKNNKDIVIKPADKGGSIVVLDKKYYLSEIQRQLSDVTTYRPIPTNPIYSIERKIDNLINFHLNLGTIDSKLAEYLHKQSPITPVIYILPKIHKNLEKPPGRPIVASTDSILSPLSITLEKILTPLVPKIPSYLKDTGDFLNHVRTLHDIPSFCLLASLDVNSLYTSIDHDLGIEAVRWFLDLQSSLSEPQKLFCTDTLKLVLNNNYFLFEDQFYLQARGTAMGANVAPPYANIFMCKFEADFVYTHHLYRKHALTWLRYIDDIFCVWTGDTNSLTDFVHDLNQSIPNLTFTSHSNTQSVSFLDTMITKTDSGTLTSDLYVKPTDRNSLLHWSSCHPRHVKIALPKSQHDRIDRIVSKPDIRQMRHDEMTEKFQTRGYPKFNAEQQTRITQRDCDVENRVKFINTYHPFSPLIKKAVLEHWPLLEKAYPGIENFRNPPLICHKRAQNLKNTLVRADVGSHFKTFRQKTFSTVRNGTFPCLGCAQCTNVSKGDSFTHPRSGKRYKINGYFTCNSNFVVYLIKCPCGLGYVGETTQHVKDHISNHKSTIRCENTLLPIPAHFVENRHSVSQLKFQVIEQIPVPRRGGNRIQTLKEREAYWIYHLNTLHPHGLNRESEMYY